MDDLISRLRSVNEQESAYSSGVVTDIYLKDKLVENVSDVTIKYDLEFEHKSWGISGVTFSVLGNIEIEFNVEGDEDLHTVTVDPSKIDVEWVDGNSYRPANLSVYLNDDLSVDRVVLDVEYLIP